MEIQPRTINVVDTRVPGSKSLSHRYLVAAALSQGSCVVENCLISEDTLLTIGALQQMGIQIEIKGDRIQVHGKKGRFSSCTEPIFLGNSGTSLRFVCALAVLGEGSYTITGTKRMQERPIQDLLDSLTTLQVPARSLNGNGCPPVQVQGGRTRGGKTELNCSKSSQYLSAMLLVAPCTRDGIDIHVTQGPVSKPYIDLTRHVMQQFGVQLDPVGYTRFNIAGDQAYRPGTYHVEPDCSQAGYFWAAAAITGGAVKVKDTRLDMRQGDIGIVKLLESMGCRVVEERDGVRVAGGSLSAIEVDMSDMPDMVPTMAMVAAFARGKTRMKNIAHLKIKESDRITVMVRELNRMGIDASATADEMVVEGGQPHGANIETYNDHRIAMSFAIAGLRVPGIDITNPDCVQKSFPNFWEVLNML